MNALTTAADMDAMRELSVAVAKSNLFAMKTPDQALALMALCRSEGLDPIQACKRYHIINGRPSLRADSMQAEFQRQGGRIRWIHRDATRVCAEFSHELGGTVEVEWTIEMAKNAGLASKETWRSFPRQMLTARVVSEGVRTVLPGVVSGFYTPEEVQDFSQSDSAPQAPTRPAPSTPVRTPVSPARSYAAPAAQKAAPPPAPAQKAPEAEAPIEAEFELVAPPPMEEEVTQDADTTQVPPQQEAPPPAASSAPVAFDPPKELGAQKKLFAGWKLKIHSIDPEEAKAWAADMTAAPNEASRCQLLTKMHSDLTARGII